ncbi:MAG TPA: hypothetical protein VKT80_19745, partial [Chloroflexota bacterium]|nr:hypothetical protein [Chloroflexota bacterium]
LDGDTGGAGPTGLVYDPENGFAYGVDFGDNSVLVINVSSGAYVTNLSVGGGPDTLAYDAIDRLLFVGNSQYSSVTIIDTTTNTIVVGQIKLGGTPGNPNSYPHPSCMVYDPQNGFVYVGNAGTQNTTLINASKHDIEAGSNLSTGDCLSMVYDPANGHVYVGSFAARIADINGTSLAGFGVYDPVWPAGLSYDLRNNLVYAANSGDQTITSFDGTTERVVQQRLPLTETFLRSMFDPLSGETYVATPDPGFLCSTPGTLTVVNSTSLPGILTSIPVGFGPEASIVASSSGNVFVANACSGNVTVIDGATNRVVLAGVPVGAYPIALGYDSIHDRVVVANAFSQNLTILNGSTGTVVVANVSVGSVPD